MISRVLLYLLMITCMLIQVSSKEVKWTVRDTSPKLGQDLTLFCEVDNCTVNEIIKGWRGGPDDKVLMANSGISTDKTKYNTAIDKHGFILTILNLTVKDLNVSYECSCGFYLDKHILYKEDVYKADNLNKSSNGTNYAGTTDAGVKYGYIPIPVILVILLIIVIVIKRHWLWRKLKKKIYGARRQNSDENENKLNLQDFLLPSKISGTTYYSATESFEPSISQKASSKFQRNSISITGTEKKESSETNSHRLPSKPDSSLPYSIRDDPTSTCPGKRYKYADIKLRELSFKTCPLNKPTIVQLTEAGFFQSSDKNIAQCFSCENKIYCNEGLDPLDGTFHNKCEYLREIISTQLQTACSPDQ